MNVGVHSSRKYGAVAIIFIFLSLSVLSAQHVGTAATQTAGLLVPLYTYPTDPSWQALIQAKLANPSVPIAAIINPSGGPGYGQDPNFVQGINSLRSAGITVLGYVATAYGSVSVSSIETQINEYKQWYNVNGIMFDEMYNIPGYESYYSTLSNYAYSVGFSWTVGNPGAPVPSSYIGTMGTIIIYENAGLPSTSFLASATGGYPTSNFAFTAYGVSLPSQSYISSAESYVSWMYITDGVYPNPYTGLPSYLYSLLAEMNTGSVSTTTGSGTVPITVQSVDQNGAAINGLYTVVQSSSGSTVATGFTPMTFYATAGQQYTITASNYGSYYFSQWSTGSTNPTITVSASQSMTLTAYYQNSQITTTTTTTVPITVQSVDQNGAAINGLYTVVQSTSGSVLDTGYTPLTFSATSGNQYVVTASSYGNYAFNHWSTGSTNPTITVSASQSMTLTAYYQNSQITTTVPITVQSVDQNGAAINGFYTVVQSSSGSTVATGFTPMTFYATAGQQYTITASNYGSYYFSQWSTGSTSSSITITPTQGTTLTAEYSSSVQSPPVLTIESQYTSGTPITGLYTVVESSSGSVLSTGFTTFSYTGTAGSTYTIAVDDYGTHHFIQWSNGSTNRFLTLSLGQSTTLIAYFT